MRDEEKRHEVQRDAAQGAEESVPSGPVPEGPRRGDQQRGNPVGHSPDAQDARAAHGLTYQWERFSGIARELPPLFKRHWREIALNQDRVHLDPNWDQYYALDLAGTLRCLTVRSNGVLVGYVFMFVFPHLHYASTLWAASDIFWLDPAYRQGLAGFRMLRLTEKGLKELGVRVLHFNAKLHFEASRGTIGKLLERMGYKPVETVYSKFIG